MKPNAPKVKGNLCIFKRKLNEYINTSNGEKPGKSPVVNKIPYSALEHLKVTFWSKK